MYKKTPDAESVRGAASEPELAIVLGRRGTILGFTLANDVSAWDIERENPLYLPQSKIYRGCFSFGPVIVTPDEIGDPYALTVRCRILRDGKEIFAGETSTARLKRRYAELVDWRARCACSAEAPLRTKDCNTTPLLR